jgi:trigger factor
MKTNLEEISPVKRKLLIEVEPQEVDQRLEDSYREIGKRAKIPGFRSGKIPRRILEVHFGKQVEEDVTRSLINETFPKAIEETQAFPVGVPMLEKEALKKGQVFRYTAVMEVRPTFEVKDYLGMEAEREEVSVTDEMVEEQLKRIQESNGTLSSVEPERPVQQGDHVVLDYEAFEDGRPIEGVNASNFLLQVGSGRFHNGFEESLIGLAKGSESELPVHFEEEFRHPALAGKDVVFQVKVLDVQELGLPVLDDDFARNLDADFNDLADLQSKIRESLVEQEERRVEQDLKRGLLDKICESTDMELPQSMVESELEQAVEAIKQNFTRSGSSLEKAGLTEEKLKKDFRPASERRVKERLALSQIAKQEGLAVTEEDLAEEFQKLAQATGQETEVLRRYYEARGMVDSLRERTLEEKTLNYLVKHAKIIKKGKDLTTSTESEKERE